MNVLLLTPHPHALAPIIHKCGDQYVASTRQPDLWPKNPDYIVSFGYRHIIGEPYLSQYRNRLINIHISMLPWNRGADPNLWSWADHTPKGVSIHLVDDGIDTGDIIAQMEVLHWQDSETLRSSYDFLMNCAARLFTSEWPSIRVGKFKRQQQDINSGSYHASKDKDRIMGLLPKGWDTSVTEVEKVQELVK